MGDIPLTTCRPFVHLVLRDRSLRLQEFLRLFQVPFDELVAISLQHPFERGRGPFAILASFDPQFIRHNKNQLQGFRPYALQETGNGLFARSSF